MALPNHAVHARPSPGISTSTIANGLRLTISTSRRTYSRDALVRVTVRAQNVSKHPITLGGSAILPHGGNPFVDEVDADGQLAPEPLRFMGYPIIPSSPPVRIQLLPGQRVIRHPDLILWAERLRVGVFVVAPGVVSASEGPVYGGALVLRLRPPVPPRVDLHISGGQVYAVLHRPSGVGGRVLFRSSVLCHASATNQTINEQPLMGQVEGRWAQTTKTRFVPPPCPVGSPTSTRSVWRLIIGWRNWSMAALSYGTSSFTGDGVSIRYPSSWNLYGQPRPLTMLSSLIAYLGTMPLGNPCPGLGFTYGCSNPIPSLPRRSVFVAWTENGFPGWQIDQVKGERLVIDGREGRLSTQPGAMSSCPANTSIGISAIIASTIPGNWFHMEACLRGPGIKQERKQVLTMLESVTFTAQ